jgi:hypothetical protein
MGYLKTIEEAKGLLVKMDSFTTGTLSGAYEFTETSSMKCAYVVRSYGVIIAYGNTKEILASAYTHSKTTSKHANIVAKAWGLK